MKVRFNSFFYFLWPHFFKKTSEHLIHYMTFHNYRKIWIRGILILIATSLLPLFVMTSIYYQLIEKSIDNALILRTERVASNTRRVLTYFFEERLAALKFTVNEHDYKDLKDPLRLSDILKNLKLGFGGLTDLSVIDHNGTQITYAGPFNLEGKDYSRQTWFLECQKKNAYVSEIFSGYRGVPHIVVAVKYSRPDGHFFIIRATLETERLFNTVISYKTGEYADIFMINHEGVVQSPSKYYEKETRRINIKIPEYSSRTKAFITKDRNGIPVIVSYAFINTKIAPTPFILVVVKERAGVSVMRIWLDLKINFNMFLAISSIIILLIMTLTATSLINKIYFADHSKAEAMLSAEQKGQLASIGQLAAGVAHEINNPLALINETAGYIKDLFVIKSQYQEDPDLIEQIDAILDAVERCGTITSQLLGFARTVDVEIQTINLNNIISEIINFYRKEAKYRNISIIVDVEDGTPEIETDRKKLQQILLNLINNAFQAIDDGGSLKIKIGMISSDLVRLSIEDTGTGIAEHHLNKVFEPFFTTKEEGKGTGLGLSITFGLVKKLHGNISVKSKMGEGTMFVITLPVQLNKEK
ncbi:integral membrane sensor signal transduction histidine kinase [Candidatus Magnetomorum sp. HK-1]|nr:integral membrane sensor signal transduction histidine kinase [Candidatus Magnetomorum sp. HK-1]